MEQNAQINKRRRSTLTRKPRDLLPLVTPEENNSYEKLQGSKENSKIGPRKLEENIQQDRKQGVKIPSNMKAGKLKEERQEGGSGLKVRLKIGDLSAGGKRIEKPKESVTTAGDNESKKHRRRLALQDEVEDDPMGPTENINEESDNWKNIDDRSNSQETEGNELLSSEKFDQEDEELNMLEEEDFVMDEEMDIFVSETKTARQRAIAGDVSGIEVEFPEGLVYKPSRKLSDENEAEKLLKREAANRRRRQQMEKAAKESHALVLQKILGQESSRKRREVRFQKQRLEAVKEKEAIESEPAKNSIRLVQNDSGTVVSFSSDIELPSFFSGKLEYPGQRESCAGPNCSNPYKYRHSVSKLPLCSLKCYKASQ